MRPTINIAALHDLASYGRCSLTCVIPILSTMGYKVCPVPTAVYSSDTGGFGPVYAQELTHAMGKIMDKFMDIGVEFAGIYSGYLGTYEQAELVERFLLRYDCPKIVDPVMGDQGKLYSAFDERMVEEMRRLCRRATVITPNLTEASFLLGHKTPAHLTRKEAADMLDALHGLTPGDAVITSAALEEYPDAVCTIARGDQGEFAVIVPRVPAQFPGTGDIFTSVLTGSLLSGQALSEAVCRAASFVAQCMRTTVEAGAPAREGVLLEQTLPQLHKKPQDIQIIPLN